MPGLARAVFARLREAGLLTLLAIAVAVVLVGHRFGDPHPRAYEVLGLVVLVACAVAAGRRYPFGVLVGTCAVALADSNSAAFTLPLMLATANVTYRRGGRLEVAAALALAIGAASGGLVLAATPPLTFRNLVPHVVPIGLAAAAGLYVSARRANIASLRERANLGEREQHLLTEQAVAAERVRIARELHDVVAHGVSLMVVQAQALGALAGAERDAAGAQIAATGREALAEMHRMLDVLRPQDDESPERSPAPGVRDVPSLVDRARGAGIDVALTIEGRPRALPAGADLSAYRIVQEALTNVIKHARALRTEVLLRYGEDELELSVVDDGDGGARTGPPGHGLVGMRERAALFGGTLEAGRRADGPGYAVRAVLPL